MVVPSVNKLRAIVRGDIALEGTTDGLAVYTEIDTHGHSCQQVLNIVTAHKMCLHLMPFLALTRLFQFHQRLTPAEL